ncbi:MAG: NAD+ synthase [Kiritimatiellia bacterium]|jgi:NAD+ synthase (glutamine-hydrolysing)|nr:NAD+ synthase [Kiritimatiellia bacterium]
MKFALVQMNPTVGAVKDNATAIVRWAQEAVAAGTDIVVFPELALCGYPPDDLVLHPRFMDAVGGEVGRLAAMLPPSVLTILGAPLCEKGTLYNAALLFHDGQQVAVAKKMRLPHYGVCDEQRLFTPGTQPLIFKFRGVRLAVHIGEDSWCPAGAAFQGLPGCCDALVNLSATPYCRGREGELADTARKAVAAAKAPMLYTNLVGGQDELVFDGGGLAVGSDGTVAARSGLFNEGVLTVELDVSNGIGELAPGRMDDLPEPLERLYEALKIGLRDYVDKNGFPGALVALSGGIDSALVAAIAVDALGPQRVFGVTLPSVITSRETLVDALDLAKRLDIPCLQIPIGEAVDVFNKLLGPACAAVDWAAPVPGTSMEENLQARIRGVIMMALSNRYNHMVVATGNKSEMATGYTTLYGDMAGGFALIKDVPKTLVFDLARWRNQHGEVIPPLTISRPPSAELKPGQLDSDSLPPYDVLDPILERYIEHQDGVRDILAAGADEAVVRRVIRLVDRSEYKRRQGAPGVKITPKAFERDRRMPITNGFHE